MKLKLLGVIVLSLASVVQAQVPEAWVVIDTVGMISIEIEQDIDNRDAKQLHRTYKKIHTIAKKLNKIACKEDIVDHIFLNERGKDGVPLLSIKYDWRNNDTIRKKRISIILPDSLFEEANVLKLYEFSKTIPFRISSSHPEHLIGSALLEGVGILPANEKFSE